MFPSLCSKIFHFIVKSGTGKCSLVNGVSQQLPLLCNLSCCFYSLRTRRKKGSKTAPFKESISGYLDRNSTINNVTNGRNVEACPTGNIAFTIYELTLVYHYDATLQNDKSAIFKYSVSILYGNIANLCSLELFKAKKLTQPPFKLCGRSSPCLHFSVLRTI